MHLADALVSPAVAGGAAVVAGATLAVAAKKVKHTEREGLVALMGVMGAFVFAAQMINFSIPGTGSSGHIVGGILLAALLGPWAALITLSSVLVVQCLVFADGGLMALGCNILNMGVCSTLVAYPLIFRPIAGNCTSAWRVMTASVAASVVGLELGALLVTIETELSGVTALGFGRFLTLMAGIHLLIGAVEGVATGLVLWFVMKSRPDMLNRATSVRPGGGKKVLAWFLGAAIVLGGSFAWIASEDPDGLEWSIGKIMGDGEPTAARGGVEEAIASVQDTTSLLPDYDSTWAGIIGCGLVLVLVWAVTSVLSFKRKKQNEDG